MTDLQKQLYATCVSIGGKGVLLLGDSGSGKSDVALRLIDAGATLTGDDRVLLSARGQRLYASPTPQLRGLIEIRGIGIMRLPYAEAVEIALAIRLAAREEVERLPAPLFFDCLGRQVPLHSLHAFEPSIVAKIHALVRYEVAVL